MGSGPKTAQRELKLYGNPKYEYLNPKQARIFKALIF